MARLTGFFHALRRLFGGGDSTGRAVSRVSTASRSSSLTTQIDPARLRGLKLSYAPKADARPDPGEVVWAWVPYEENDGRGKDRPVLIVARLTGSSVLGIQLTSTSHDGDRGALRLGPGPWDSSGRASWARLDRLFRVSDGGMRREGAALDARTYARVANALTARYRF
ncbi:MULTISPECIES: type II toxin-antitoxin system PemK/MazF family toxin [Subtercola]|uniref:Type II toxin-antitoxin system PemK/MazF family toxin n=1 Tax=Subtercola vilae TaxID=2056433 RepID=A0A4T2BQC9_9MICO|nr:MULTISPECIES: type II toxin-antitoxin system PemK/MazF family toxin [Subtercola]MEA9986340.1 type II toxin-antitoxin system PemK/MazF family toxin [Subtercola sp. RTI3]TIH33032.1 type II toxin-antitoxin system PemK/MazF family toxin [Subtercola vilae]